LNIASARAALRSCTRSGWLMVTAPHGQAAIACNGVPSIDL
jgi:hypothetical protein